MEDGEQAPPKSALFGRELAVRVVSAIVILVIASTALWFGGWLWVGFVALISGGVLFEWNRLVGKFGISSFGEVSWLLFGAIYVGAAALAMISIREAYAPVFVMLGFFLPIIAVDVGAYFAGRIIGGPKIAPSISPSKTWAGLIGGAIAAALVMIAIEFGFPGMGHFASVSSEPLAIASLFAALVAGAIIAVFAQTGDFFESWMKRRAGVKDSSNLIPGHGGLFDRLDGFLAVFFVVAIVRYFL